MKTGKLDLVLTTKQNLPILTITFIYSDIT